MPFGFLRKRLDEIFLFVHIPKCAGTTLTSSLKQRGTRHVIELSDSPESKEAAMNDLQQAIRKQRTRADKLDVLAGHDVFVGMHEVSTRRPFYFTVLRDPVKRYVSHYHHMVDVASGQKGMRNHYANASVVIENGQPIGLHEFAKRKIMTNVMTNYLASAINPERQSKRWEIRDPDLLLEMAEKCLRSMSWIGLVERFPADLDAICERIGVHPASVRNKTVTGNQVELSEETMELIEWNNSLDTRLYRIAEGIRRELDS